MPLLVVRRKVASGPYSPIGYQYGSVYPHSSLCAKSGYCTAVYDGSQTFRVKTEFEQRPNESAKAFAAFSLYLSLGPQRSLAAVSQKLKKSEGLMARWSGQHRWVERTDAYVRHLAKVEAEAQTALLREKAVEWGQRQQSLREEEWTIHEECIRAAREALKRFYERGKGATLGDVARLLDLASKLGRLSSGLATDKTEVTGPDNGPIRVEFEEMLKKIYSEPVDVEAEPVWPSPLPPLPEGEGNGPRGAASLPEKTDERS